MTAPSTLSPSAPSALLREKTAADHRSAESSPFQRQLVAGKLPRALYERFLNEMLHVWRTLEASVDGLRSLPNSAPLLDPERFRAADIERDMKCLNATPSAPTAATTAFCDRIRTWGAESPTAIAGVLYVLEGSTNGGRYIARNVRRAYGFTDHEGTRFIDPYGEAQPQRWAEWKVAFDEALPDAGEALLPVAQETFRRIEAIGVNVIGVDA